MNSHQEANKAKISELKEERERLQIKLTDVELQPSFDVFRSRISDIEQEIDMLKDQLKS